MKPIKIKDFGNQHIFTAKEDRTEQSGDMWMIICFILAAVMALYVIKYQKTVISEQESQLAYSRSHNVSIWEMDQSCYQQLKANGGIIRLVLKK